MCDTDGIETIRFMSKETLEKLVHQLKVDPTKFERDIVEIEQELLIRSLTFCKPVIDLI